MQTLRSPDTANRRDLDELRVRSVCGRSVVTNALCRAAGQDPETVHGNDETARYVGFGGAVVLTGIFAASSMYLALGYVRLPDVVHLIAAVVWGLGIFNFDRLIVSSLLGAGWRRTLSMLARLTLAVFLGVVIAVPLLLRVFQSEVDDQLASQFAAADKLIEADVRTNSDASKQLVEQGRQAAAADQAVTRAAQAVRDAVSNLDSEVVAGRTGAGYGPVAKAKNQQLADLRTALASAQAEANTSKASVTADKAVLEKQIQAAITDRETKAHKNDGFLARLDALDALVTTHGGMRLKRDAVEALFIIIDSLPVLLKLLIPPGKTELDKQAALDRHKIGVRKRLAVEDSEAIDGAWAHAATLRAAEVRMEAEADHAVAAARIERNRTTRIARVHAERPATAGGLMTRKPIHVGVGALVAVALLASGTVAARNLPSVSTKMPTEPKPTLIRAHQDTVVDLGGGATLTVPAGAIKDGARVVATHPQLPASDAGIAIGRPVSIRTVPEGALVGSVTFRFPAGTAGPSGVIRTYNERTRAWEPATAGTTYEATTGMLVATSTHFSDWGAFFEALGSRVVQDYSQVLGWRAPAAECHSQEPHWVENVAATNEANAPLRACAESEGDTLVMQLVNNRPYSVYLRYGSAVRFGWTSMGTSASDVGRNSLANGAVSLLGDGLFIPPLGRASVGIERDALAPGKSVNFEAKPNALTVVFDAMFALIDAVGEVKADRSGLVNSLAHVLTGDCLNKILSFDFDQPDGSDIPRRLHDALSSSYKCLRPLITDALLNQVGGISREAAGAIFHKLDQFNELSQVLDTGKLVNSVVELLRDAYLGLWGGFGISSLHPQIKPTTTTSATAPTPGTTNSTTQGSRPATTTPTDPQSTGGALSLTITSDPFICDGRSKSLGSLLGALAGERVDFSSPEASGLLYGTADGDGRLELIWQCNPGESGSVHLSASGASSGRTGVATFQQQTPEQPPYDPPPSSGAPTATAKYTGNAFTTAGAGGTTYSGEIQANHTYTIDGACFRPNDIASNNGWYYRNAATGHWAPGTLFTQSQNEFGAPRSFGGGSSNCN